MEEKKEKVEEIQSRREFFKSAAKKALPILGAVALTSMPVFSVAKESKAEMGCEGMGSSSCFLGCDQSCKGGCAGSCNILCQGSCQTGCLQSCYGTCSGGCARSAYA